uniref:protein phosphatase 1 regulatory subunit 36 n=1 Tax=Scatophagus argus TaxID=75038 RepID=UPI001ED84C1F|nr:protein phosphatase 1 regulatory subunit 36 [Scatophagus argus]
MMKFPEDPRDVRAPLPGRWMWNDEAQTMEFVSSSPAEESVLRKRRQTNVNFNELQQRAAWLADVRGLNDRGRQSTTKSLSPARLNAYRSSVTERRGDRVTTDDVKQVAVGLLQENHLLPIPFCFLAVLKSEELDEVLKALLLYLSCFFERKSLENKPKGVMAVGNVTERRMRMEALTKKEIAQKKLAVSYFSLIMDLEKEQHQPTSNHKSQMSSDSTDWLLHACLYSFFCYVAWVTFGRKDLRDIQEEVGRLLYSDTFNTAVRNRTAGDSGMTFANVNGSVKTGKADPKERRRDRTSRRRPALSSTVNQRSPLMVSLLPSPKEQSPHLFLGSRARKHSLLWAEYCDTKALTEELNQQLASVSFGILGKPSNQFSRSTLIPYGEQKNNRNEHKDREPGRDVNNNSRDGPGIDARGSSSSFMGPESTGLARYGSTTRVNTRNSAAPSEAVTSDAQ